MSATEVNFDGLVGPTHSYAGLSFGNVASLANQAEPSNPREAALQGLDKMRRLHDLGVAQAVLPPHERPTVGWLRGFGFEGDDAAVLAAAARDAPELLASCASASAMWAANAATVAPRSDCGDGRTHFTPANLSSKLHRALEPATTARVLRAIFADEDRFAHHPPLAGGVAMSDEGAANHTRLGPAHGRAGLHVFVYGRKALDGAGAAPRRFPARQSFEASTAVARLHRLAQERTAFVQQSPAAVDAGVFHNDVISVGNEGVLLYHDDAFVDTPAAVAAVARRYRRLTDAELTPVRVSRTAVPLADAIASYLFNSQLVTLPDGAMALIAPNECAERESVRACIEAIVASPANPIDQVHYLDVRQSMRNGGGPACLRLRVVLEPEELDAIGANVRFTPALHETLRGWVQTHYRDRLVAADLADPALLDESRAALDALSDILRLGSVYDFQRARGDAPA